MSEAAILEEVHNWLGLSLDFLVQDQNQSQNENKNQDDPKSRSASQSPVSTEKSRDLGITTTEYICKKPTLTPAGVITPPASTEWESPVADTGVECREGGGVGGLSLIEHVEQLPVQRPSEEEISSLESISNYAVGSPVALLEESSGLVLGSFVEDLARIYFRNVHPYYPVVDEFDFDVCFVEMVGDAVVRESRAMVLCAMFLCASMFLDPNSLNTPTSHTKPALQKSLLETFQSLHSRHVQNGRTHFPLTQTYILLSYYSPSYPEPHHHPSSYLSKAFTHARLAGIHQTTSETMTDRSRLVWCCLLVRDREMGFVEGRGLHPLALAAVGEGKGKGKRWSIRREDFGLEVCLPRYASPSERGVVVDVFLMGCGLSEVLGDIVEFGVRVKGREVGRKEVLRVSSFDVRLREWKRGFWGCMRGGEGMEMGRLYARNLVADSATVTLYLPYIQQTTSPDPLISNFALTAMKKVKEASCKTSETIRNLLSTVPTHQMPPFLSLWLPLPILTLLVSLKFNRHHHNYHKNHHQTQCLAQAKTTTTTHLLHLFSALATFRTRYRDGQTVLDSLLEICRELHLGVWDVEKMLFEEPDVPEEGETEAATLTRAVALVGVGFGGDGDGVGVVTGEVMVERKMVTLRFVGYGG